MRNQTLLRKLADFILVIAKWTVRTLEARPDQVTRHHISTENEQIQSSSIDYDAQKDTSVTAPTTTPETYELSKDKVSGEFNSNEKITETKKPTKLYPYSILSELGYIVGKKGKGLKRRRRILDGAFKKELPQSSATKQFSGSWGRPQTETRLEAIANVISDRARSAIENSENKDFSKAISDWLNDLEYLRTKHYRSHFNFKWPNPKHSLQLDQETSTHQPTTKPDPAIGGTRPAKKPKKHHPPPTAVHEYPFQQRCPKCGTLQPKGMARCTKRGCDFEA